MLSSSGPPWSGFLGILEPYGVLYIVVHPSITTTISRQDCIYEKRESQQVDGSKIGPTTVASRYWIRSWIEVLEGGEVTEGH